MPAAGRARFGVLASFPDFALSSIARAAFRQISESLLSSGEILVAAGFNDTYLNSAEVFDPASGKFMTVSGGMSAAREGRTAVLFSSGKVLVTGGCNDPLPDLGRIVRPGCRHLRLIINSMAVDRQLNSATVLSDRRALLAGGLNATLLTFDANLSASQHL